MTDMDNKLKKILKKFKSELIKIYDKNLDSVILFGSRARNDFIEGSDIDVLILLNNETKPIQEIRKINSIISDISLNVNNMISCVFMSKQRFEQENSPLILNIKKEGIVL